MAIVEGDVIGIVIAPELNGQVVHRHPVELFGVDLGFLDLSDQT
jgi:hypothetical protein